MKVETHNHPTAIAPFPGAATGAGGEIRDEGATGRGAKPKAGLVGYTVSNLRIPGLPSRGSCPSPPGPLPEGERKSKAALARRGPGSASRIASPRHSRS